MLATLLSHLDRSRFELHLALLKADKSADNDIPSDVAIHNLDSARVRYVLPALVRLINNVRPDVVLSTVGHMNLALLLSRPFLPGSTRILIRESTTLRTYLQQATKHPRAWTIFYRSLYKHADSVICLSDAMLQELEGYFSVPRSKLVRIYNPVDAEKIRATAELQRPPYNGTGPHLVTGGRFVREKGIDVLLDAMPRVLKAFSRATLTLLGEGPLLRELQEQGQRLGIGEALCFPGVQANPWRYFRDADLVVVPSRVDGLPSVPLEARALGTRVVATDCPGGIREIAEADNEIILVAPENPEALAVGIISALTQPRIDCDCQALLNKFSLTHAVDEYSALFEPAMAKNESALQMN